jgi:hypothetical protein
MAIAVQARRHNSVIGFLRRVHGVIHVMLVLAMRMVRIIDVMLVPGVFVVLSYVFMLHR